MPEACDAEMWEAQTLAMAPSFIGIFVCSETDLLVE